jgi:hypothetical protein
VCTSGCTDLTSDFDNCGACDSPCDPSLNSACVSGVCQ